MDEKQMLLGLREDHRHEALVTLRSKPALNALRAQTSRAIFDGSKHLVAFAFAAGEHLTRAPILRMTGVDLVAVHGSSDALAQTMLAEIGTDMSQWPTETHFCSWLGLALKHEISGGKVLRSRTMKHRNGAAQAFRMAAQSVSRSHGALGAFSRRIKGRLGPAQALVATTPKIARIVYHMFKDRVQYDDIGAAEYNNRFREREMQSMQKKAAKLGYTLSPA